jgi:hypothetical protein
MVLLQLEWLNYMCSTEGAKVTAITLNLLHEMFHSDESLAGLSGTVSESPGMLSPLRQSATHSVHENDTILSADTGTHFKVIL